MSSYEVVEPELIPLSENLKALGINQDQLIAVAMLVGTDYNIGGVKGIGPKKALGLVKKHKQNFDRLFKEAEWNKYFDFSWKQVFELFKKIPVTKKYKLKWTDLDEEKAIEVLCTKHDFNPSRVKKTLERLHKTKEKKGQKGLKDFF